MDQDPLLRMEDDMARMVPVKTPSRWANQPHPARFLKLVYTVWEAKGVNCFIVAKIVNLLVVLFVFLIILIVFGGSVSVVALQNHLAHPECPNHEANTASLFTTDCYGNLPVDTHRLATMHWGWILLIACFIPAWLLVLGRFLRKIPSLRLISTFYQEVLNIPDVTQVTWPDVVGLLIEAQAIHSMYILNGDQRFDALFVANVLTREDNFFIALYTHNIINTSLFGYIFLPYSLHWCIQKSIGATIFNDRDAIAYLQSESNRDVAEGLTRTYRFMAVITLVLSPLILVYRMALFVFCYADEWRTSPKLLTTRQWSNLAHFQLRDYCEVPAVLQERLSKSYRPASEYSTMFPSQMNAVVARFGLMVLGGITAVLLLGSVIFDEEFLTANLSSNRSVGWWLAVLLLLLVLARSFVPDEYKVFQPTAKLAEVSKHIHHYPFEWQDQADSSVTHRQFCRLFPYRVTIFIEELLSVFMTPVILAFVLPKSSLDTVKFIRDHSTIVPNIGNVCNMAMFNRSDLYVDQSLVSSSLCPHDQAIHPKMEASYINFRNYYNYNLL